MCLAPWSRPQARNFSSDDFLLFQKWFFEEGFYIPKLRNIVRLRGLNLIISCNQNAQDQFTPHACAEDGDLRDSGKLGAVAKNPPALSLRSLSGARHRSQHCGDGSAA